MKITRNYAVSVMLTASFWCLNSLITPVLAQDDKQAVIANATEPDTTSSSKIEIDCSDTKSKDVSWCNGVEHIKVKGQRFNPISVNSQGVYTLDKTLIRDYRFGNGNLNDILGILPGVQYGESHYSAEQVSNIKPGEVSISGADGHQSGYYIDGVNNNSRLNSDNAAWDRNMLQDVSGHSQEMFINLQLLDQIEVYDSNIPAEYGQFSGGLVKARTRDAEQRPHFGISYRQTNDSFITFNKFYGTDFNGQDKLETPTFEKQDIDVHFSSPIGQSAGILAQLQYLTSEETKLQLGKLRPQQQTNYNALLKYHQDVGKQHYFSVTGFYAPYHADYFDTYAINSDYRIEGGGYSLQTEWRFDGSQIDIESLLSWRRSENSKTAPDYWFTWRNAIGKDWGDYNGSFASNEGGYGDIDKTQQTLSIKQNYLLPDFNWLSASHSTKFGGEYQHQSTEFHRLHDTVLYNGAILNPNINCSGYTLDCVQTSFYRPVVELEAELGRPFDFTNFDDLLLYQSNISQTGQYFQTRQVSPAAKASVAINAWSFYAEHQINWSVLDITAGLRYDYNDFFRQHNVAPRLRLAYDIFNNNQTTLVAGANRYYEADLLQYKLNQAMQPNHTEIRRVSQNRVLSWEASLLNRGYRTVYQDTETPFSDELSLAIRQQLLGGTLEAKWLRRDNKKSINRKRGFNEQGEAIMFGVNDGSSTYQRYSLSWMARFDTQHVEINLSYATNTTDRSSFDGDTTYSDVNGRPRLNFSYDDSELVYLQQIVPSATNPGQTVVINDLITRNDLLLEKQDFNRPVVANLSWGAELGNWRMSLHARYNAEQEAMYATGQMLSIKEGTSLCNGCAPNQREYPLYRKEDRPAFWLLNATLRYELLLKTDHVLTFSLDAENILNGRTYQISQYDTGTELGRRFWLGVSYNY